MARNSKSEVPARKNRSQASARKNKPEVPAPEATPITEETPTTESGEEETLTTESGKKEPKTFRLHHPDNPENWIRVRTENLKKYGPPKTADGRDYTVVATRESAKAAREKKAAEERARIEAMTPEQRLEYVKEQAERRKEAKAAKEAARRRSIMDRVNAELDEEGLSTDAKAKMQSILNRLI